MAVASKGRLVERVCMALALLGAAVLIIQGSVWFSKISERTGPEFIFAVLVLCTAAVQIVLPTLCWSSRSSVFGFGGTQVLLVLAWPQTIWAIIWLVAHVSDASHETVNLAKGVVGIAIIQHVVLLCMVLSTWCFDEPEVNDEKPGKHGAARAPSTTYPFNPYPNGDQQPGLVMQPAQPAPQVVVQVQLDPAADLKQAHVAQPHAVPKVWAAPETQPSFEAKDHNDQQDAKYPPV